jgi:Zn-dependent protease
VALAGPASNIVFAVILAMAARLTITTIPAFAQFAAHGVYLSLYLAIFNMIPVPPLDGSKLLLAARLPVMFYNELARFGFVLLVVAMSASNLGPWMAAWSMQGTQHIFNLVRF